MDHIDNVVYSNCTFKIIHPYFDDPIQHYEWTKGKFKILVSGISNKGKFSICLFELDSEAHTLARAKQVMFEEKLRRYNNRQAIKQRVLQILAYHPQLF